MIPDSVRKAWIMKWGMRGERKGERGKNMRKGEKERMFSVLPSTPVILSAAPVFPISAHQRHLSLSFSLPFFILLPLSLFLNLWCGTIMEAVGENQLPLIKIDSEKNCQFRKKMNHIGTLFSLEFSDCL